MTTMANGTESEMRLDAQHTSAQTSHQEAEGPGRFTRRGNEDGNEPQKENGLTVDTDGLADTEEETVPKLARITSKARESAARHPSSPAQEWRRGLQLWQSAGKAVNLRARSHNRRVDLPSFTDVFTGSIRDDSEELKNRRVASELHHYARVNNPESMLNVMKRFDVNIRSTAGRTVNEEKRHALHIAAMFGSKRCVQVLLEHGVNPNLLDLLNVTPLDLAELRGMHECAQELITAGARHGHGAINGARDDAATFYSPPRKQDDSNKCITPNTSQGVIKLGGVSVSMHWALNPEHILIGAKLGEGSFGTAFNATWHGSRCALKTLKTDYREDSIALKEFERELSVWTRVSHPNICALWGVVKTAEVPMAFVSEYIDAGSLRDLISQEDPLLQHRALKLAKQLASALSYLHNRKPLAVIHRDVKPENCLLNSNDALKLSDFGLSRLIHASEKAPEKERALTGGTGALRYMSPENFNAKPYNVKTDVYSAAVLTYELMEGQAQITVDGKTETHPEKIAKRASEGYRPAFAKLAVSKKLRSAKIRNAINAAWLTDVEARNNASEFLQKLEEVESTPLHALDPDAVDESARESTAKPQCCTQ